MLSQPARGGRGWGAGRRRRRDRFQAQKGRLAHLVGARPTWGVNQCAARPAAQRRVRPALRGLPALPPLRHAVPHFRLQSLTCDPGPANQRTPPLRDGAGQPQLGQSEPSLESGEGRPSPWVPRCLKPEAPMDAPSQKPAGSPSCLPFKRRLSWVGILSVAREGALHRLRASGPPPGVPWEAGLCWRPGPFSTSHRATEPPSHRSRWVGRACRQLQPRRVHLRVTRAFSPLLLHEMSCLLKVRVGTRRETKGGTRAVSARP